MTGFQRTRESARVRASSKPYHDAASYLQRREVVVDEKSQAAHRDDQELHPESVVVAIVGGFELGVDQVHQGVGTSDVNDLYQKQTGKTRNMPTCIQGL